MFFWTWTQLSIHLQHYVFFSFNTQTVRNYEELCTLPFCELFKDDADMQKEKNPLSHETIGNRTVSLMILIYSIILEKMYQDGKKKPSSQHTAFPQP